MRYKELGLSVFKRHCERKADYLLIHRATPTMLIVRISGSSRPRIILRAGSTDCFIHKGSVKSGGVQLVAMTSVSTNKTKLSLDRFLRWSIKQPTFAHFIHLHVRKGKREKKRDRRPCAHLIRMNLTGGAIKA